EVLDVLESHSPPKILLHCFSGNSEEAKRANDLGYFATIPPGSSKARRKVIKALDLDNLLLESDAPY
ncbi:MAG: TatD family hydrolase, partial [Candidatus Micrarchaeota archaeon]